MTTIIWGLAAWAMLSVPLGLIIGRGMARMNPTTERSDAADWGDIRTALAGMLPGAGMARPATAEPAAWAAMEAEAEVAAYALPAARNVA
jgi:hypothetical protein